MGLSVVLIGMTSVFKFLSIFLVFLLGLSFVLMFVPLQTLIQQATPFDVRGRVFGALNLAVNLASALPLLVAATLVDFFGLKVVLFATGGLIIFLAFLIQKKKAMILNKKR